MLHEEAAGTIDFSMNPPVDSQQVITTIGGRSWVSFHYGACQIGAGLPWRIRHGAGPVWRIPVWRSSVLAHADVGQVHRHAMALFQAVPVCPYICIRV